MAALEAYETEHLCHLCGLPKELCRAYETDGRVDVTYERCHVATALARKQKANAENSTEYPGALAYTASVRRP